MHLEVVGLVALDILWQIYQRRHSVVLGAWCLEQQFVVGLLFVLMMTLNMKNGATLTPSFSSVHLDESISATQESSHSLGCTQLISY
jgi:hypothetical protein